MVHDPTTAAGKPEQSMGAAYLQRRRRTLLDMHIPDWDTRFLSRFDPAEIARYYEEADVNAAMVYCKSHTGLCYWPTRVGRTHPAVTGGEIVGALVDELHRRDILVCGYTSVIFDNYAADEHPEWEVVPANITTGPFRRHRTMCFNKPGYLDYEKAQLSDLLPRYRFDAFFLDMLFWTRVCRCTDCAARWQEETGTELPQHVDWSSPRWAQFQDARERWADEFAQELLEHTRSLVSYPVYQNFAPSFLGWSAGKPIQSYRNDAFVGADLYGGRHEQLFVSKVMLAISQNEPPEYMTCRSPSPYEQALIKTEDEMKMHVFGATSLSCAALFTNPVNPDGTTEESIYQQLGRVFRETKSYEPFLGGEHVADVAIYFSSQADVDLLASGTSTDEIGISGTSPHRDAAIGACRALQRMHVSAGVATYQQLDDLKRYRVVVVPDLARCSAAELNAFRAFVTRGGRLYASGRTSLLKTDGTRSDDFLLADVFAVHYEGDEQGEELYLKPARSDMAQAAMPQAYVPWRPWTLRSNLAEVPRLTVAPCGDVLATLTLPYGYPAPGTYRDREWANMYTSPPWDDTDHPVIVQSCFGEGRVVYSALPLERHDGGAAERLFGTIIKGLLDENPTLSGEGHQSIWLEGFHQREHGRYVVSLLNYQTDLPAQPCVARFTLSLPIGRLVSNVLHAPNLEAAAYVETENSIQVDAHLDPYAMFVINYNTSTKK